jgi:hypothetical protein
LSISAADTANIAVQVVSGQSETDNCTLATQLWHIDGWPGQPDTIRPSALGPLVCLRRGGRHASNVSVTAETQTASCPAGVEVLATYTLDNITRRVFASLACISVTQTPSDRNQDRDDVAVIHNPLIQGARGALLRSHLLSRRPQRASQSEAPFTVGLADVTPDPDVNAGAFGVGQSIRASLSKTHALLIHDRAFCWNSFFRDDDVPPFYYGDMVCDSFVEGFIHDGPSPSTLAYTFGQTSVLKKRLQRSSYDSASLVTSACDDQLLHGTFDMGTDPHAFLLDDAVAVSVHLSIPHTTNYTDCGSPIAGDQALMLDAWSLPDV